jgi:hypothetical protein
LEVGNLIKDTRWLRWCTWLFLACGCLIVLGRCIPPVGSLTVKLEGTSHIGDDTGSLFWVWLVALAGGQALNRDLPGVRRLAFAGLALATLCYGWRFALTWDSGFIPPLVALLALLWLRAWKLGAAITLIGLGVVLFLRPDMPGQLAGAKEWDIVTRTAAYQVLVEHVLPLNPVLGLGFSNYWHYASLYPIMGYAVEFNSHDQYLDIVLQTGFVGGATFLWLMEALAWLGLRLRGRLTDGFAQGYVDACLAGLAGSLAAGFLGDWFLPFVYNIGIGGFRSSMLGWFFLGGLVAIEQMTRRAGGESPRAER